MLVSDRRALLGDIAHPFLHARTEVGVTQLFSGEDVGSSQAAFTLAFARRHGLFGTADREIPLVECGDGATSLSGRGELDMGPFCLAWLESVVELGPH